MVPPSSPSRGVSPAVGVVLLTALTVVLAASVAAATLAVAPATDASNGPTVLSATATTDGRLTLRHRGGAPLVAADLRVRVTVDGVALRHQPPVPFVGARGFRGAPTGPFNRAGDGVWTAGERAGVVVAGTNHPTLTRGSTVEVMVFENGRQVAVVETVVHTVDRKPAEDFATRSGEHRRRVTVGAIRPRLRASRRRRRSPRLPARVRRW